LVGTAVPEIPAYYAYAFPEEHWPGIATDNPLERILRKVPWSIRAVGAFPDGHSALNLAAARLRHSAGTPCSTKRF
jgi:transposase-like protein